MHRTSSVVHCKDITSLENCPTPSRCALISCSISPFHSTIQSSVYPYDAAGGGGVLDWAWWILGKKIVHVKLHWFCMWVPCYGFFVVLPHPSGYWWLRTRLCECNTVHCFLQSYTKELREIRVLQVPQKHMHPGGQIADHWWGRYLVTFHVETIHSWRSCCFLAVWKHRGRKNLPICGWGV